MLGFVLIITGLIILITAYYFTKRKSSSNTTQTQSQQTQPPPQKIIEKKPEPDLFILFGSQTGCAERLATILTDEGISNGLNIKLYDLEEYDEIPDIENKICIFLVATQGEGEPTDNTRPFLKWFKKQNQEDPLFLKNFKFAVFGLGSTDYEHYNAMGKKFNTMIEKAGAQRIYKYGEGDDSVIGRLENNFTAWKSGIWEELKQKLFPNKVTTKKQIEDKYNIILSNKEPIDLQSFPIQQLEFQTKKQLQSSVFQIKSIKQLRQNTNDGSTLHFILAPLNKNFAYTVSQNLDIYPMNSKEKCNEVAELLGIDLEQVIEIKPKNETDKFPFPSPILLQTVLQRFCDFQGIIMKKNLIKLSKIAKDTETSKKFLHKQHQLLKRLLYMTTGQGIPTFEKEILSQMKTIIDLLKMYHIKPTLSEFIELTNRMAPRAYTISSSPLNSEKNPHLTIHIEEDLLPNNSIKKGVAGQYFELIEKKIYSPLILAQYRESPFVLPKDKTKPIIMISVGCGIAPFRGFVQENLALFERNEQIYSNMILYYGCRHSDGDFIYRDELNYCETHGILKKLHLAFSRDQQQKEKIYVQTLIQNTTDELNKYLDEGIFYMCGKASMGKEITDEIQKIFITKRNQTLEQAQESLKKMEENKQFFKELWG